MAITISSAKLNISESIQKNSKPAEENNTVHLITLLSQNNQLAGYPENCFNQSSNYDTETKNVDNSETFKSQIANWVNQCNVSHTTVNKLLPILKQHECFNSLPLDCRTLLHSSLSKITDLRFNKPGFYFHFELRNGILKFYKPYDIKDDIKVIIGIDGLPLAKSSSGLFWFIIHPLKEFFFIVGLYYGFEKLVDSNEFLKEFIGEAEDLVKNGVDINGIRKVSIFAICADAPAK